MHKPVLLKETIDLLDIQPEDIVVDGTLGGGGHSKEICKKLGRNGVLVGFDRDHDAVERVKAVLEAFDCKKILVNENFRNLDTVLQKEGIEKVDKVLLDLGFSSFQLEESGRGFSFQKDEPLLMNLDKGVEAVFTARDIVNSWDEEHIADILYGFGEERFSRKIAKGIVEARSETEIENTAQLVEIIRNSVPAWYKNGKTNPATKTFQALRIAVNDEFGAVSEGIAKAIQSLKSNGRVAVITFHSLEDRIVKRAFKQSEKEGLVKLVIKKPIAPSREEIQENPRARSAKLRVVEKI